VNHRRTPGWIILPAFAIAATLAAAVLFSPPAAQAQSYVQTPYQGRRPLELDLHAGFVWHGHGLATGARFSIPIVHNGFIPKLNNAVFIDFGADFYFIEAPRIHGHPPGYRPGLGFPVAMCWEFYFSDKWSAFGEVGVNVMLDPWLLAGAGMHAHPAHWILFGAGGRFRFNDTVALVLRVGLPYAVFGVTFMF
jgi:hypothetical protein